MYVRIAHLSFQVEQNPQSSPYVAHTTNIKVCIWYHIMYRNQVKYQNTNWQMADLRVIFIGIVTCSYYM